jgi:hypothetical protein
MTQFLLRSEEFHGLDLVDEEISTGEDVGGAAGEGSGGPSEMHKADHTPSLSDSDSSGLDWELYQELEDDPRDDFFLDAPTASQMDRGFGK